MCGRRVRVDGFRHRAAYQEYFRTGLCQGCQDRTLTFDAATGVSYALRRALVVGAQPSTGAVAGIPFVCTGPGRPTAWEARHCVFVAPEGAPPCDPWGDLEPLADVLADHQIRVHEAEAATDPSVAECLDMVALVVGPDRAVLDACAEAFVLPVDTSCVALGDVIDWAGLYGARLNPLHRFALRAGFTAWREPDAGALRRCAWLAAALALPLPGSAQDGSVVDAVLGQGLDSTLAQLQSRGGCDDV